MTGEDLYKIEQALPTLGKLRRQAPTEGKYKDRVFTTWLSFLGLGTRNVGATEKRNEMYARDEDLRKRAAREKELGRDIASVFNR